MDHAFEVALVFLFVEGHSGKAVGSLPDELTCHKQYLAFAGEKISKNSIRLLSTTEGVQNNRVAIPGIAVTAVQRHLRFFDRF